MNDDKRIRDASQDNDMRVNPEEFPDGPVGASTNEKKLGKSTEWKGGQYATSAFVYENKEFHAGLKRQDPSAHPTHVKEDHDNS